MKKKNIGVDLDDTLLDFNASLSVYHNNLYGTSYSRDHIKNYDLAEIWNCSLEESHKRILDFYQTDSHWAALPIPGAVEATEKLSKDHNLFIVSAKPDYLRENTLEWLEKNYPNIFDQVHFTNQFYGNINKKKAKGEICQELNIEIFVEDSLVQAEGIAGFGIKVLLLDSPWNQGTLQEGITRVYSWDEIESLINK